MNYLRPLVCSLPIICMVIMTHVGTMLALFSYFLLVGFSGGILYNARRLEEEEFNLEDIAWSLCWPILWGRTLEQLVYGENEEEF